MMPSTALTDARNPSPPPGIPRPRNIKALTSIRFFAALYVALNHLVSPWSRWGGLEHFMSAGYIGVSYFFILSGFILTYTHAQEYESGQGNRTRFWVARFARVYPVYLVSMVFAAYVYRSQFHEPIHIAAYAVDLLMMQSWSIRVVNFFNVPAWSLSTEVFFYAVFPFIILRLRPTTRTRSILFFLAMWVFAIAVPLFCLDRYPGASWGTDATSPGIAVLFWVRRLPLLALPQFLGGVALGWFYLRYGLTRRTSSVLTTISLPVLILCLFFSNHIPLVLLHNGLLMPLYAMLILGLCEENALSRLLSVAPLVLLGEASYALYLIHFLFNDWTKDDFNASSTISSGLWKVAIVVPISIVLHLLVERPARRVILQWWRTRTLPRTRPVTP